MRTRTENGCVGTKDEGKLLIKKCRFLPTFSLFLVCIAKVYYLSAQFIVNYRQSKQHQGVFERQEQRQNEGKKYAKTHFVSLYR